MLQGTENIPFADGGKNRMFHIIIPVRGSEGVNGVTYSSALMDAQRVYSGHSRLTLTGPDTETQ